MIIIQVAGGLGNQLQQYALYKKLKHLGKEVKLDISWFSEEHEKEVSAGLTSRGLELNALHGISYESCTKKEREKLIGSKTLSGKLRRKLLPSTVHWFHESRLYHSELLSFDNMYVSGYFACEKYYEDILCDLRQEIQFPKSKNPENERLAKEMQERNSVSIHIRRGDYLNAENRELFGNICTENYYQAAIEEIRTRFSGQQAEKPYFYIFSDDAPYAREHYMGEEFTVVDVNVGQDSFYDMWLMSQCKHNICANSTFSFWGARLNANPAKIMIRPTIHKNTQTFDNTIMKELWNGWNFISPEGKLYRND